MSHVTYKYLFSPKSFDIIIRARYHHESWYQSCSQRDLIRDEREQVSCLPGDDKTDNGLAWSLSSHQLCFCVSMYIAFVTLSFTMCTLWGWKNRLLLHDTSSNKQKITTIKICLSFIHQKSWRECFWWFDYYISSPYNQCWLDEIGGGFRIQTRIGLGPTI